MPGSLANVVLRRVESAYTVEVEGEAVILDEANDHLHLLNATGALVWACLNGESTLGEICADLAEVLGAELPDVLAGTGALARRLNNDGLVVVIGEAQLPEKIPDATDAVDLFQFTQTDHHNDGSQSCCDDQEIAPLDPRFLTEPPSP